MSTSLIVSPQQSPNKSKSQENSKSPKREHSSSTKEYLLKPVGYRTDPNQKQVISSQHKVDQLGKDSPGVGAYNYDYSNLTNKILAQGSVVQNFSFSQQRKFFDFTQNIRLKQELQDLKCLISIQPRPHYYDVNVKTKWVSKVGGFPKDQRFKYELAEKLLADRSPGPTTATPRSNLPSIKDAMKTPTNLNKSTVEDQSYRSRFEESRKIFFRELERDVQGKDSPGFVYDAYKTFTNNQRKNSYTFGRRKINDTTKSEVLPAPGSYQQVNLQAIKLKPKGGGFSKATRNVDLVNYSEKYGVYGGQVLIQ
ncbi:UNKNOWN [Stylonychia lemnae]|uniref:Uncharacterized protein n=1 Tax=Stylonychia lemnae TaxID=5949 RepID=A0A077ZU79_STYLE|nr:UNKNOWN [Stylonychia lemnae]|eukprot:CDW73463.1 UNKNOWN [Stylonychia lemnae]